jgi:hypothetical protein
MALALVAFGTLQVGAATVTATLDPAEVALGDSVQLTVTVSGAQGQPEVPEVDGLDIRRVGQSTQIEVINGSITANASSTYNITPQREGAFTIPAIHVGDAASKPVTLRVTKGAGITAAPSQTTPSGQGPVVLPPPAVASGPDDTTTAPQGKFGSLQVTIPKKEFYEGELVPIEVRAVVPDDLQASVSDLPQFASDGFTMNSLSNKPQQSQQIVNGRACAVLIWHTALTAVKPGEYPFSLQMPITVVVQQRLPRNDQNDDIFGNFFKNAFASMGTKKNVTLQSEVLTLKVLHLPQANRPADFSGAVGQFEAEASATPDKVNAGDPITLRLKVTGEGNFDRVSSDMLAGDAHWKTYSPKSHFDADDSVGYQGAKTFEQPVIPLDGGISSVPSLSFSFFDPEKREYVTRTTLPISVTVSGSSVATVASTTATSTAPAQPKAAPSSTPTAFSDLRPNKIESGTFVATLQPIYLNPWFLAAQGLPFLACLAGLAFIRRQEKVSHPERKRATAVQQAIRQQIQAMDEAIKNRQTDAFFIHARSALQQRLGQQWNLRPETITLADVDVRLGGENENIRSIFEMADQASYSDLQFEDADLRLWRQVVLNELAEKN